MHEMATVSTSEDPEEQHAYCVTMLCLTLPLCLHRTSMAMTCNTLDMAMHVLLFWQSRKRKFQHSSPVAPQLLTHLEELVINFLDDDVHTGQSARCSDARAHEAAAQHGNLLHLPGLQTRVRDALHLQPRQDVTLGSLQSQLTTYKDP